MLIFGLTAFLVISLTVLPVIVLLLTAFRPKGSLWLDPTGFSLESIYDLVTQPGLAQLIYNTTVYVGGTIALATIFATVWAWITERTDFRYKVTVRVLMLVTLSLPSLIQGFEIGRASCRERGEVCGAVGGVEQRQER